MLVVFRSRPRLLPLVIALAAAGITFGLLSLVGGTLTMASIAVLPILIGLAVDYAIQFQSRAQEAPEGTAPTWRARDAVKRAAAIGAPTIATAALATGTVAAFPTALEDRLHQPYRAHLAPGLNEVLQLRAPGLLGCALSGAGPSILVPTPSNVRS